MKIAMLAPVAWGTPPAHYGPWELFTSLLTEGLVARGVDVTLFATGTSETKGKLHVTVPHGYAERDDTDAKVWEALHIGEFFENAHNFDLLHNNFDFLPLSYSRLVQTPLVTTIHGFSSQKIVPVYAEHGDHSHYVAISSADRHPDLDYLAVIHHGIPMNEFEVSTKRNDDLLFFGRIHPHKGAREAIAVAHQLGRNLTIAGIIQDEDYFKAEVEPHLHDGRVNYVGPVSREDRSAMLGSHAVLMHLISFAEPFGLSVVESMACGTPVVAFPLGSMRELIEPGVNGFLSDSIGGAAGDVGRAAALDPYLVRASVEKKFSLERMVDEYVTAYKKIIK